MTDQPFRGKRVIVTGGAGFIGSQLVDALLIEGAERVGVIDNLFLGKEENLVSAERDYGDRAFKFYHDDASQFDVVQKIIADEKPDMVFNLATKALLHSFEHPEDAFRVNTDIALVLGKLLRDEAFGRLVHFSTSEVYGSAQTVPMDEDHPLMAETTYAAGKAAADLLLSSYHKMFGLNIVTVRPFNNYGPRQNEGHLAAVIPLTVDRIFKGEAPVIQGDGLQTRDFIFVDDTIKAVLKLVATDDHAGEVFNLGSGHEATIKEIVETLCHLMGYEGEIVYDPGRKADVLRHCAGIDKARDAIGDLAHTSLTQGLRKTVDWYREKESQ